MMTTTHATAATDPLPPTLGRLTVSQTLPLQLAIPFGIPHHAPHEPFALLLAQLAEGRSPLRAPPRPTPRAHPHRIRPEATCPTFPRPLVLAIAALFGRLSSPPSPPPLKAIPPLGPPTPLFPTRPLMPTSCGPIRPAFSCSPWPAFARAKAVKANQIKSEHRDTAWCPWGGSCG